MVTDQGFLKQPRVVWETLSSIDGDGHFVDENLVTFAPGTENTNDNSAPTAEGAAAAVNIDIPPSNSQISQE